MTRQSESTTSTTTQDTDDPAPPPAPAPAPGTPPSFLPRRSPSPARPASGDSGPGPSWTG